MKLRILDDSIRLRLARAEVDRLAADGTIEATTHFPGGGELTYRLTAGPGFGASQRDGAVTISVPDADVATWAEDDSRVGLYADLELPVGALKLIVEKDYHCLIPRPGIDPADFFPNPKTPRVGPEGSPAP